MDAAIAQSPRSSGPGSAAMIYQRAAWHPGVGRHRRRTRIKRTLNRPPASVGQSLGISRKDPAVRDRTDHGAGVIFGAANWAF